MKRIIFLFFVVFVFNLNSEEVRIAAESEPQLTVAGCVNIMSGDFFQVDQDFLVEGPMPLQYTRYYDAGDPADEKTYDNHFGYGVGVGYPLRLKYTRSNEKRPDYSGMTIDQRYRYSIPFNRKKDGNCVKANFDKSMFRYGYTNCTEALERGFPSLVNTVASVNKNRDDVSDVWEVYDADGTRRVYTYSDSYRLDQESTWFRFRFLLRQEDHPNGLSTYYSYDCHQRISKICLKNSVDQEELTSISIYHDGGGYQVFGSDGRWLSYRWTPKCGYFENRKRKTWANFLTGTFGADVAKADMEYILIDQKQTRPYLTKISWPEGRFLEVSYKKDGAVSQLWGPLDSEGHRKIIYSFAYGKHPAVRDALGNIIYTYKFDNNRLHQRNEGGIRTYEFLWDNQGQLLSKSLGSSNGVAEIISYKYDQKGNISQKLECGNITGEFVDLFPKNHSFKFSPSEARSYDYIYDDKCKLVEKKDPNGTVTYYGYKPGTNLLTSKLTSFEGVIQEREFFTYDKNAILIEKIEDDGSGNLIEDLSNVTYRRITRIQPQMDRKLWGLTKPAIQEESYLDLATGQEQLLKRIEFDYVRGGNIGEKRVYDASGALAYTETFHYNSENFVLEEKSDRLGRVTRYRYDANRNVVFEELVGSGKQTHKSYDFCNRLIEEKEIHEDGTILTTTNAYDLAGNLISTTDPNGFTTQYFYDILYRKIKEIDPYGHEIKTVYDIRDNPISVTDKEGHTTRTRYNIDHKPIKIEYPDGTTEQYSYFTHGLLKCKTEKDGSTAEYTYDYRGRVLTETRRDVAKNIVSLKTYIYKGEHLIAEIDPRGITTTYTYDGAGRQLSKTKEDIVESYQYDALGRLCTTKRGERISNKVFDVADRIIEENVQDLSGNLYKKTLYEYDLLDNVTKKQVFIDENHYVETCTLYNSANLPILEIDGMGHQTKQFYAYGPFQKTTIDPLGQTTITTYDAFKKAIVTEIPNLMKQEVVYSPNGHRIKQIDHIYQQGQVTGLSTVTWKYDAMGNHTSTLEQDLKETSHTYLYGRLHTTTKPDGIILSHQYDALGRLSEQSSSDGTLCLQYTYDPAGNMLSAYDKIKDVAVERTYDAENNIISETTHTTLNYSYDALNRLTKISFPDSQVTYTYNPTELISITRGDKQHLYHYDMAGRRVQEDAFDGSTIFYTYDDNHYITSITAPYYVQNFVYDAAKNIIETTINGVKTTYNYDGLYQLIGENGLSYSYDSINNRLSQDSLIYQYNSLNQLLFDDEHAYKYDLNGNRLSKDETEYTYDVLNRLTSVGDIVYEYDSLGRLCQRASPNATESFLYYKEIDLGTLDNLKILGKGIAAIEQNGVLYSVVRDHRGSPTVLLSNGTPFATYSYTSFGVTTHTGSIHSPWQYSAHRCDPDTLLLHAPKRIYDPALGRWLTPDPLGFADGPNLYAYAHNNPMIFIDPTGLWTAGFWESTKTATMKTFRHPRVQGGIQAFGGLGEMGIGASMTYASGGSAAYLGWPILAHGMDQFLTGMNTLMTGIPRDTATSQLLQRGGVHRNTANLVDAGISLGGGIAGVGVKSFQATNTVLNASQSITSLEQKRQILFGQKTVNPFFSKIGDFKMRPISEIVQELRMGTVSPNDLPLNVIMRNGQMVTLNNRSLLALRRAKLEPTIIIDRTGIAQYEDLLELHLKGGVPSDVIKIRGGPPGTSLINHQR